MDEILNGDLESWRWSDAATIDFSIFWWVLIGLYGLVFVGLLIRVLLKCRDLKIKEPTVIGKASAPIREGRRLINGRVLDGLRASLISWYTEFNSLASDWVLE